MNFLVNRQTEGLKYSTTGPVGTGTNTCNTTTRQLPSELCAALNAPSITSANSADTATYNNDLSTSRTNYQTYLTTQLAGADALLVPANSPLVGYADRAGYPVLAMQSGYQFSGSATGGYQPLHNPYGIVLIGAADSEQTLLSDAFAIEQQLETQTAQTVPLTVSTTSNEVVAPSTTPGTGTRTPTPRWRRASTTRPCTAAFPAASTTRRTTATRARSGTSRRSRSLRPRTRARGQGPAQGRGAPRRPRRPRRPTPVGTPPATAIPVAVMTPAPKRWSFPTKAQADALQIKFLKAAAAAPNRLADHAVHVQVSGSSSRGNRELRRAGRCCRGTRSTRPSGYTIAITQALVQKPGSTTTLRLAVSQGRTGSGYGATGRRQVTLVTTFRSELTGKRFVTRRGVKRSSR